MIAIVDQQNRARTVAAPTFEELLPTIQRQAAVAFRSLPMSEQEDMEAEVVANAYCAYQQLADRGKADMAYASPLAQYAIKQIRAGRRVGSRLNVRDVSSTYAQRAKGIKMDRLDMRNDIDGRWQQVVVEDKTAGPAEVAATRIDFAAWLKSLTPRMRRIAKTLATGETTKGVASRFGMSPGRVSQLRRELRQAWHLFQGDLAFV